MSKIEFNSKHHLGASLLAVGLSECEAARRCGIHRNSLKKWKKKVEFQALIHEYTCILAKAVEEQAIDEVEFLAETVREAMKDPAKRSDGLRAAEILLKLKGRLTGEYERLTPQIVFVSEVPRPGNPENENVQELETGIKQLEEGSSNHQK